MNQTTKDAVPQRAATLELAAEFGIHLVTPDAAGDTYEFDEDALIRFVDTLRSEVARELTGATTSEVAQAPSTLNEAQIEVIATEARVHNASEFLKSTKVASHDNVVWAIRRALRAAPVAPTPAVQAEAVRISQLERALVYVAHKMHSEPQYMLAEGITLGDVSFVRVQVGDVDVQVSIPEADARSLYAAARASWERKVMERHAALAAAAPSTGEQA